MMSKHDAAYMHIEVRVSTPGYPYVLYKHLLNQDEAEELGLVPLKKPFGPSDLYAADYRMKMARRKEHTERIGLMIAHDLQRFLEGIEADS